MVPIIIAKGRSFKGAAAYLLHDKDRSSSSERVAWTDTRNLASKNADLAWRIMAATALDQERLKHASGVKSTGRKSDRSVLHLSLAWHPDEKKTLLPEEMMRAARGAIAALGAEDRQALIICHTDEAHPHLHILINRVSPEDGRMLSSSKEKLALSQWAENYERERGKILCEERVLNNEAREAGHYTRGDKPKSRREVEERSALGGANDNYARVEAFYREQRETDAALADRKRRLSGRHHEQWDGLRQFKRNEISRIAEVQSRAFYRAEQVLTARAKVFRKDLHRRQASEMQDFERREEKLVGRIQNAFDALRLREQVRGEASGASLGRGFDLLSASGARRKAIENRHQQERRGVLRQLSKQRSDVAKRLGRIAETGREKLDRRIIEEAKAIRFVQAAERAALKAAFRARKTDRSDRFDRFETFKRNHEKALEAERAFGDASTGKNAEAHAERVRSMHELIKAKLARDKSRDGRER